MAGLFHGLEPPEPANEEGLAFPWLRRQPPGEYDEE